MRPFTDEPHVDLASDPELAALRQERRRLSDTVARLTWLRRVVGARCDLEVARMTGLCDAPELDPQVRQALCLKGLQGVELLDVLARAGRSLDTATIQSQADLDEVTGEFVARLAVDPARCLIN